MLRTSAGLSDRSFPVPALLLAILLPLAGPAAASGPAEPWDGPAFSASPAALVRAASQIEAAPGEGVVVLLLEASYSYDEAGRETSTQRLVYRIASGGAHESWSAVEASWSPWHQERPRVRARVVTPDGVEHPLDPSIVTETGVTQEAPDMFQDGRVLRGPLPATRPGAIVEQEVTIRETAPFFDAGVVRYQALSLGVTVRHARVTLEAPAAMPLRWVARKLPGLPGNTPRESEAGGRRRVVFEARDVPPAGPQEPGLPPDEPRAAYVAFSTGRSWEDLARRYSEIVEQTLKGSDLKAFLRSAKAGQAASQLATIDLLLDRIGDEVRYTGVELGEGGLIPRSPAETLRRKFGDCKDKAVLLTALLRASDIPAYVALLNAGEGEPDVEESLPGLGGFNHAIVMVPGTPPIWIDPTDRFARAGELPPADQGRLALVASPNASGLVRTPEAASADNREVETREFFLADLGRARVVETTEFRGAIERELRSYYAAEDPGALREALEEYVSTAYRAEHLTGLDHSDPFDLSEPLRLRLEADAARTGVTDVRDAAVAIQPAALLSRLPAELSRAEGADGDGEWPRAADYVFVRPFSVEARYRVVPPAGYAPQQPLPPSRVRRFGPALLEEEYAVADGGVITATLRFDTGPRRRLSAVEFEALRRGALEVSAEKPVLLAFEQVGESHLAAGRVREALTEFERLAAREPKKALPRSRAARALLAGGMGEAAREEARRAVQLEPGSAIAHRDLGWILQHDDIGRRFGPGFDRAGAIAAYRKAKALDPEDPIARADLAILLEHDAEGERYGAGADLAAAIDEYKALRADLENGNLDDNLLVALLRAGRLDELRETASGLADSQTRSVLRIVATAMSKDPKDPNGPGGPNGPDAALREAERRFPDEQGRIAALGSAAQTLMTLRRYAEAAALLERASRQAPNAAALLSLADFLRKARPSDEIPLPPGEPATPAKRLMILVTRRPADPERVLALFSRDVRARVLAQGEKGRREMEGAFTSIGKTLKSKDLSVEAALEIGLAGLRENVTGSDASGWRVRLESTAGEEFSFTLYAVPEEGEYRIAALAAALESLGAEALRRLERGDLAGARQWLDWAAEEIGTYRSEDPLGGMPFPRLWTRGREASAGEARCAAAALMIWSGDTAGEALPVLRACRQTEDDGARVIGLDLALLNAQRSLERWADLLETARRLRAAEPSSDFGFAMECLALKRLDRSEETRTVTEERLARNPDDLTALRVLSDLAEEKGELDTAAGLLGRLVAAGKATDLDFNNLAWLALVRGRVDDAALEHGQRAATLSGYKNDSALHTLAALYADRGRAAEAYRILLQALEARDSEAPQASDWLVFGQLAEHYGRPDLARRYYQRVDPPQQAKDAPMSSHELARRRLQALGGDGKAKKWAKK
jgi:tetratricopeptide (TPR) repeat protein